MNPLDLQKPLYSAKSSKRAHFIGVRSDGNLLFEVGTHTRTVNRFGYSAEGTQLISNTPRVAQVHTTSRNKYPPNSTVYVLRPTDEKPITRACVQGAAPGCLKLVGEDGKSFKAPLFMLGDWNVISERVKRINESYQEQIRGMREIVAKS